jgi:interleukin-1 receptor-associated kinase 1
MHRLRLFVLLLVFLPHETSYSAAAASDGCNRRCGGAAPIPYPFGFSAGCPIALYCDANTSTPILPYRGIDNGTSYRVLAFNSTASTVVLALLSSCSRSVPDAKRALSGANYGVSSRTGLFLRGGCRETNSTGCTVPAPVMSNLLRTAQCGDNGTASAADAVACVASASPNATSTGGFLRWDKAENTTCDDVLTSVLFAETPEGTVSLEFGLAELGWWLNGTCAAAGKPCVANATCTNVKTPSDGAGHRCACLAGMDGDGFSAGDGCYLKSPGESSCVSASKTLSCKPQGSVRKRSRLWWGQQR